jgi:hypothetical protein
MITQGSFVKTNTNIYKQIKNLGEPGGHIKNHQVWMGQKHTNKM